MTVQSFLGGLDSAANLVLALNFSSRTTSADVQRALEVSSGDFYRTCTTRELNTLK